MVHYAELIDPKTLATEQLTTLIDELYALHCRLFIDFERTTFERYVVFCAADYTRIQVLRDGTGQAVGYGAVHAFTCSVDQQQLVVVRSETGILPEHRGRGSFSRFLAAQSAALLWRYRNRKMYGFACATYPATYRMISRYVPEIYPHWERPTPVAIKQLMGQLARNFQLQRPAGASEWVRQVGWRTRPNHDERAIHRQPRDPATRFYLSQNPSFRDGTGMLMLVPFGAKAWLSCLRQLAGRLKLSQLAKPKGFVGSQ